MLGSEQESFMTFEKSVVLDLRTRAMCVNVLNAAAIYRVALYLLPECSVTTEYTCIVVSPIRKQNAISMVRAPGTPSVRSVGESDSK